MNYNLQREKKAVFLDTRDLSPDPSGFRVVPRGRQRLAPHHTAARAAAAAAAVAAAAAAAVAAAKPEGPVT